MAPDAIALLDVVYGVERSTTEWMQQVMVHTRGLVPGAQWCSGISVEVSDGLKAEYASFAVGCPITVVRAAAEGMNTKLGRRTVPGLCSVTTFSEAIHSSGFSREEFT